MSVDQLIFGIHFYLLKTVLNLKPEQVMGFSNPPEF